MKHFSHKHLLILHENYDARESDVCRACNEQVVSCKSFVYSCSRSSITSSTSTNTSSVESVCVEFLLHKRCAIITRIYSKPNQPETVSSPLFQSLWMNVISCNICSIPWRWFTYYSSDLQVHVCLKCAMYHVQSLEDRKFHHPAHNQHSLTLVQRPSSFKCDACNVEDNNKDLSYICTKCPFWMHKSCAHAPTSFRFSFHNKHPLILSFSLPQVYHKFDRYCTLCNKKVYQSFWLYYCPNCRFFAHFHCARSSRMLRSDENVIYDSNLVHLPAADESSLNLLVEQFVKAVSNNNSILSATNHINHWAHDEHHLQLISFNELNDQIVDDEILLLCDGCANPIRTDGDLFYGCVLCKYFLHKVCAELPKEIEHHLWPGQMLLADKCSEPYISFICDACGNFGNGIFFHDSNRSISLHIGCTALPRMIKHEAHSHQLNQGGTTGHDCKACGQYSSRWKHRCEKCDFYICARCIMKARTVKHQWDPHPLHLIYDPGMLSDHEHEFDCEFCSNEIDTNFWFYHCSDCDFSIHLDCFEKSCYRHYSNIKFGATDIIQEKLDPHCLTFILNKKVRRCENCYNKQLGEPVLECAPCKTIICISCCIQLCYLI